MNRASRRGAALATGGIAGLALATLVLPQLANSLNPTALGIGLLTLVLGLATLALQRLGECYRRRNAVRDALRVDPGSLASLPLAELGVYPPPRGDPAEYCSRRYDEDAKLRSAIEAVSKDDAKKHCVIVVGPRECGKSRAASEAARNVVAARPVLVPFDAGGLRVLQDNGFNVNLPRRQRCVWVWLDGLDRFAEALDPRTLGVERRHALVRGAQRVTGRRARQIKMLATIRSGKWKELRAGSSQESENVRALGPITEPVELTPQRHFLTSSAVVETESSGGSGEGTQTGLKAPSSWSNSQRRSAGPRPPWWDGLLIALCLAVTGISAGIAVLWATDRKPLVKPPSINHQLASITSRLNHQVGGGTVVLREPVRLHEVGEPDSWVIGFKPRGAKDSDVLEIYDNHDGWLVKEFSFQPRVVGLPPALTLDGRHGAYLKGLSSDTQPANFFDNDGTAEFIAGYQVSVCYRVPNCPEHKDKFFSLFLPFGIEWVDGSGYALLPLTSEPPHLAAHPAGSMAIEFHRAVYGQDDARGRQRVTLPNKVQDPSHNHGLAGYLTAAFALSTKPNGRLLLGYLPGRFDYQKTNVFELHVDQIRTDTKTPTAECSSKSQTCFGPRWLDELVVPPDKSANSALLKEWPKVQGDWSHVIQVRHE